MLLSSMILMLVYWIDHIVMIKTIKVFIDKEEYVWDNTPMDFECVVMAWNEINAPRHITGNPGIDYSNAADGSDGILLPGESVEIKDGTKFNVSPYHNG